MNNEGHLLTLRETAARLRQSEKTIRRKIRNGELLAVRLGKDPRAPLRVPKDYLEAWLYADPSDERSRWWPWWPRSRTGSPPRSSPAARVKVRMIGKYQTVIYDNRTYHSYEDGTGDVFTVDARNAERLIDEGMVECVGGSSKVMRHELPIAGRIETASSGRRRTKRAIFRGIGMVRPSPRSSCACTAAAPRSSCSPGV